MLKQRATYVAEWVERLGMRLHARGPTSAILSKEADRVYFVRPPVQTMGDVDHVSPSVETWLRSPLPGFLPDVLTAARSLRKWIAENDTSKALPRAIGFHQFTLRKPSGDLVTDRRATTTHALWMVQRIVDRVYGRHAEACDTWLAEAFGEETARCWRDVVQELQGLRIERAGAAVRVSLADHKARL